MEKLQIAIREIANGEHQLGPQTTDRQKKKMKIEEWRSSNQTIVSVY